MPFISSQTSARQWHGIRRYCARASRLFYPSDMLGRQPPPRRRPHRRCDRRKRCRP